MRLRKLVSPNFAITAKSARVFHKSIHRNLEIIVKTALTGV